MSETLCTVIGFDPGETTGFCVLAVEPARLLEQSHDIHNDLRIFQVGEIDCVSQGYDAWGRTNGQHLGLNMSGENIGIERMLELARDSHPRSAIAIEDFIPDMRRMDQARHTLSPVRLMAGFTFGLWRTDDFAEQRIFVSDRANPKTTCNDERLEHWGLYRKRDGTSKHSRDALRHALYFLRNCVGPEHKASAKRHLAWPHLFDAPQEVEKTRKPRAKKIGDRI